MIGGVPNLWEDGYIPTQTEINFEQNCTEIPCHKCGIMFYNAYHTLCGDCLFNLIESS